MFSICGYNFCRDKNALDETAIPPHSVTAITLQHGIFDHWNVTRDVTSAYSPAIPTTWDTMTVMDANFNGTLDAGNVDFVLGNIDGFRIKRRKVGEFDWVTLKYIPVSSVSDYQFSLVDNLAQSLVEYEYAIVPVLNNVEGNYITETIGAKFDGVFICDADTIYKFYAGVAYGANERVHKVALFEPYGRKYPVVVSNALLNYETGSVQGTVLPPNFLKDGNLNTLNMIKERKALLDFLTNKKAKILKDWNGNIWCCIIVGSPTTAYNDKSGMSIADVYATWAEIGDANSQSDLYAAGLIQDLG